ncbi:MAG: hypothetical protein V8Q39_01345 [Anaerovoracaceae bacterium]
MTKRSRETRRHEQRGRDGGSLPVAVLSKQLPSSSGKARFYISNRSEKAVVELRGLDINAACVVRSGWQRYMPRDTG